MKIVKFSLVTLLSLLCNLLFAQSATDTIIEEVSEMETETYDLVEEMPIL